ncbi:hypothetical protein N2152v2_003630 [Parachlorella kessleri]
MAPLGSKAVAALLGCAKQLRLEPSLQFKALSIFADSYLPAVGSKLVSIEPSVLEPAEWQLLLSAVACLLLLVHQDSGQLVQPGKTDQHLVRIYRAAGVVLGPEFEQRFSSNDLVQMEAIVAQAVGPVEPRRNTITFLKEYFQQIQQAGIKAFNSIEIDVCYVILELLYIDGAGQFKGTIDRGGKLMAAALITAAFAIAAPPAEVKASLPFLAWLSELSGFPKEVIKSQAASILQHVMP